MMTRRLTRHGFTLVELIIVIVITGILAAVVGPLIGNRYQAVTDARDRAEWTQQAEFALFHIRQDLQRSVPNSIRTREPTGGADQVMELLTMGLDQRQPVYRYRDRPYQPDYEHLQPNNDDDFDVFGVLDLNLPVYVSIAGANASQIYSDWNNEQGGGNQGSIAEIDSYSVRSSCDCGDCGQCPVTQIDLGNNHRFPDDSPHLRSYFTDGPVGYECADNRLVRHSGYTNLSDTDIGTRTGSATTSRVVDNVVDCSFSWQPGFTYRPARLNVSLAIGEGNESVRLVDSIVLGNGL